MLGSLIVGGAELFLFIAIERGIAGAAVSITGSNSIAVGLLNWIIDGVPPTAVQSTGILVSFAGILMISLGDTILQKICRRTG